MTAPKLFMSYSWSSSTHEQWVIDLATELRESGVDVILDKWDLKEGHDAISFMELELSHFNGQFFHQVENVLTCLFEL